MKTTPKSRTFLNGFIFKYVDEIAYLALALALVYIISPPIFTISMTDDRQFHQVDAMLSH